MVLCNTQRKEQQEGHNHISIPGHQNPNPRKLFFCNFTRFIDSRLEKDEELIIGIDANETDVETSDLHKFLTETDLVDAFRHAHPNATPPNMFQHNSDAETLLQGVSLNPPDTARQNLIANNPICCD
eukprot:14156678-Ditylum_brightwellii.AAC.1